MMMTSKEIRKQFLEFFKSKQHAIVESAPIVIKNDPTLMFTNAGMNQFKDLFLGNKAVQDARIANSQKCLRVSGKHNDLEEVGVDTYHHTMFEMLGNWSFGNYFKEEAIGWAWELLTEVYEIPKDRLYVTIFEGDKGDSLAEDAEALNFWKKYIDHDRIIPASKKDNFWEMGETGPCGPCSEIHIDLRDDSDRKSVDGKTLVNEDHPEVVEVWNLVFMQYNRMANGDLVPLPNKHVDTGMGFERLCMALQNKKSNYDTDVFTPLINKVASITGKEYGVVRQIDIAIRVISDHVRAIAFTINDGQLPSNTGAGYVIRRILRRAVRYAYSYLDYPKPILHQLLPVLVEQFGDLYPQFAKSEAFIAKVILEEESSFLKTLDLGLKRFSTMESQIKSGTKVIDGSSAFELYDTFGFPIDLTRLIAEEKGLSVDEAAFALEMEKQKTRARAASKISAGDWIQVHEGNESEFIGYDYLESESKLLKYREVEQKKKKYFQMVLDVTPFYSESGGQVGDTGTLLFGDESVAVFDTKKENNLIVHYVNKLPSNPNAAVSAKINKLKRNNTNKNHSGTHLLHSALREVLGDHVAQKGSLVNSDYLRFDFSHFSKLSDEEVQKVEQIVNGKIRENISLIELRNTAIQDAMDMGAMALFGEKYGEFVRVIIFDKEFSVELCGGTHVKATGELGYFKITTETSVAAGVRRIEAISGPAAEEFISKEISQFHEIKKLFKNPKGIVGVIEQTLADKEKLTKEIEGLLMKQAGQIKNELKPEIVELNGVQFLAKEISVANADMVKKIAYDLKNEVENLFLVLAANLNGKAHLTVMLGESLVSQKELNAGKLIRVWAKNIQGGGGGQDFYASAGGKNPDGISAALEEVVEFAKAL